MDKLTPAEILPLDRYLGEREAIRAATRQARARRRVRVGDRISLSFENRQTVLFQIQEMLRVEEITDAAKVAEEVAVYNDLVPGSGELRATFFVEITERASIKAELDSLVGLEREGLWLVVDGQRIAAEFEPGHAREDRISAVHYVRFSLPGEVEAALREGRARAELVVEHPGYRACAELGAETLAAIAQDLAPSVGAAD